MTKTTELLPVLNNQKSYYKKANIKETKKEKTLISYTTKIATIKDNKLIYLNKNIDVYTQTTLKHLKDFLYQTLGMVGLKKRDIVSMINEL